MQEPTSLDTLRSLDELESVRSLWSSVHWYRPDADIDFVSTICRTWPQVIRPHVLVGRSEFGTPTMLVARLEEIRLPASVGYKALYRPRVKALTVVHGGVSDPFDARACAAVVAELERALQRGEADVAVLPSIRLDSPLYDVADRLVPSHRRDRFVGVDTHRRLVLPESYSAFLASLARKTRDGVKRYGNRLTREFGDRLSVDVLRLPGDLDRIFSDVEPVAAKTYQRGLGVALADTPEQRALVSVGLEHGWFRLYLLRLDGSAIAFWPGQAYNGTFFIGTPGYDPAYADYRVGMFLQMRMIEDLCQDNGVTALDYGFGDAEYKRRFSNESWEETTVTLFAPTLRALSVNALRTAVMGADQAAKRLLVATGLHDRVRRLWRDRLKRPG